MPKLLIMTLREAEKLDRAVCRARFPARCERAERFAHEEDRLRCLAAGALIHGALGIGEDELVLGSRGKPGVRDGRRFFNVSHSGGFICCAADDGPVGVDIECVTAESEGVLRRVLNEDERNRVREKPSDFSLFWTLKEAVMKAEGLGFALPPQTIDVLPATRGEPVHANGHVWHLRSLFLEGMPLSLCCGHEFEMPQPRFLTAEEAMKRD